MDSRTDAPAPASRLPAALLPGMPEFRSLLDAVRKRYKEIVTVGLSHGATAFVLGAVVNEVRRPVLWVVPGSRRADTLLTELRCWWPEIRAAVLPAGELLPYHFVAEADELGIQRLDVMGRWVAGELDVLIVPAAALVNRMVPVEVVRRLQLQLEIGMIMPPLVLSERLVELGYRNVPVVEKPGEFVLRGGILDCFPPTAPHPVRVEWFDDEVDSIRQFDVTTQRTVDEIGRVVIGPARELVLTAEARQRALAAITKDLEQLAATQKGDTGQPLRERVTEHLEALQARRPFPAMSWYIHYAYPESGSIATWMPGDALCIVEEWFQVREALEDRAAAQQEQLTDFLASGLLLPGHVEAYLDPAAVRAQVGKLQGVYVLSLPRRLEHVSPAAYITLQSRSVPNFRGQWELVADELKAWRQSRRRILLSVGDDGKAQRLQETLRDHGVEAIIQPTPVDEPAVGQVVIAPLGLPQGFELDSAGLVVIAENELRGRPLPRRRRRPTAVDGLRIRDYTELTEGDYVVHTHHGVGRYVGVRTMEIQGVRRDYLVLQYLRGDRLYVPTDQLDLVQKYVGAEGREPKLNKLGGAEWGRVKERVRQSVRQMAEELLELYAAREASVGHAFSPDGPWQREFEEAFPHEETEDQLRAIAEIKRDMESSRPMDRLLCGDVGFGKTEVAMRAAFKAVADGKQVAVLVPTTILAQQHYKSFKERFAPFPVTIRMLSRFQSVAEHAEILTGLRRGTIDIVIATHRLIQGDIGFKDLGLLIIDEEHRFGVAQKEQIKRFKHNVDVLSLTATPIPRTLHMALSSLRDMSVIATPPEDRYPVQTYVVEYSEAMVRDAIRRELARGGQVFYVHNRVHTIAAVAAYVQRLVPEARVAVAHGQMDEEDLERVMLDFLDRQYDVLVCTTIIESGLDIANVNTLIVEDADHLGLAQLYQLRGRVGRSNRVAYAYLTYRREKTLTEGAQKRLEALKTFTDLGSGFKLALRDLEIRGAGNILGPEQHGFIASVGFELYSQLLAEAVRELRGEQDAPKLRPAIDLRWDAYIPDDYISDSRIKVDLYRRIEQAETRDDLAAVRDEMLDRFGPMPEPVWNLILAADFRRRAAACGVVSITQQDRFVIFDLVAFPTDQLRQAGADDRRQGRRLEVKNGRPRIIVRLPQIDRRSLRKVINSLLSDLEAMVNPGAAGDSMKMSPSAKN